MYSRPLWASLISSISEVAQWRHCCLHLRDWPESSNLASLQYCYLCAELAKARGVLVVYTWLCTCGCPLQLSFLPAGTQNYPERKSRTDRRCRRLCGYIADVNAFNLVAERAADHLPGARLDEIHRWHRRELPVSTPHQDLRYGNFASERDGTCGILWTIYRWPKPKKTLWAKSDCVSYYAIRRQRILPRTRGSCAALGLLILSCMQDNGNAAAGVHTYVSNIAQGQDF